MEPRLNGFSLKLARILHGAVWTGRTKLCLAQDMLGVGMEWARQVQAPTGGRVGDVEVWDAGTLIDMTGGSELDLLKVDIERAELAVFGENPQSWLPRVRNIAIELHGQDCEEIFFRALSGYNYDLSHAGDLTFCLNLTPKLRAAATWPDLGHA